jgi:hypothetical protein
MNFGDSAYLVWLRQVAPQNEVVTQLRRLLYLIDKDKASIIDALTKTPVSQESLCELIK